MINELFGIVLKVERDTSWDMGMGTWRILVGRRVLSKNLGLILEKSPQIAVGNGGESSAWKAQLAHGHAQVFKWVIFKTSCDLLEDMHGLEIDTILASGWNFLGLVLYKINKSKLEIF